MIMESSIRPALGSVVSFPASPGDLRSPERCRRRPDGHPACADKAQTPLTPSSP